MTDKQQTLREAFEEWAKSEGYLLLRGNNGYYRFSTTHALWQAWQAAARWADK